MNNKILAHVKLPAARIEYDVYIPLSVEVGSLGGILAELLAKMSDGRFLVSPDTGLWNGLTGELLDPHKTISQLGLGSGAVLLII